MKDFYIQKKIYYHDTDSGGVVYYANYLKHLEEARTEYFLSRRVDLKELADKGIWFVVAKDELSYKSPAKYQDTLKIFVRITKIRAAAMEFHQEIMKDTIAIVEARTTLVCVGRDFKPREIPARIKQSLTGDI